MANMSAVAGMLAQSGQNIGQVIGAPIQQLGQNVGGMLSQRAKDRRTSQKEAEARALLEQYGENPDKLRAIAQEYAIKKDPLANVFAGAAQAALARASKRVDVMNASRARADARSEAVGTRVDAMGTELERTRLEQNAIKKAGATGDEHIVEGLRGADSATLRSYLMKKPKQYTGPKQKIAYIPKGGKYSFETGSVDTKTINAPVDPETGEIQKEWLADFLKYSAKGIIGMGNFPPEDNKKDGGDGQVNGQPSSGNGTGAVTPRKLLNNFSSTAGR